MKIHLLTSLTMTIATATSAAPAYQDFDALDARIASLAGSATAVPIDRRIKLVPCPEEPEISGPAGGALTVRCPALGWRIRVAVTGTSGTAGPASSVLVHRGDAVELVAHGDGYSVSSVGVALEEGPVGGAIRVKIPTSPSPVAAVVARAGVASISN
ncbi:hypothetical protein GCM10022276_11660 [Sphingomonas limnosediminicola]|uniref:Flagella basal body P-ring formation protein FlgA SAF domain-containing protein n=1 Tax=Sphingomonas limnosediminicola TaxID=940133 RepID=A0ABP7L322_9SPHN